MAEADISNVTPSSPREQNMMSSSLSLFWLTYKIDFPPSQLLVFFKGMALHRVMSFPQD